MPMPRLARKRASASQRPWLSKKRNVYHDGTNLHVLGRYDNALELGGVAQPPGVRGFFLQLDAAGAIVANSVMSLGNGAITTTPEAFAVDDTGDIFIVGTFTGTTFHGVTVTGTNNSFLLHYSGTPPVRQTTHVFSGTGATVAALDVTTGTQAEDAIFVAGHFLGMVDFDPPRSSTSLEGLYARAS